MTSEIQQLLETLMDYNTEEQQEFLEIVCRINNMVKNTSQREKKMQQGRVQTATNKKHQKWKQKLPLEERRTETFNVITVKNKDM